MNAADRAREFHRSTQGKIGVYVKIPMKTRSDLAVAYTPGVAVPCKDIADDPSRVWEYTNRGNSVAIVTDGSAVLGLGNIGPEAALPVMEGKAALFKELAGIDAYPICLGTQDADAIIRIVLALEPTFGGINLEDIAAPRCFEIEEALKREMSIPVFHDDQHGTAIVVLAGLMNAMKAVSGQWSAISEKTIVISGAGAAGFAIATMLLSQGATNLLVVDRRGIISRNRDDLNAHKTFLAASTNPENIDGSLEDALRGADAFIGVSAPRLVTEDMVRSMNEDPIVFAMANPDPEILPAAAKRAGAKVVATGRSDFPNQVNNILAFPGVFRGALDGRALEITEEMNVAAAKALAAYVDHPTPDKILPDPLDRGVAKAVAEAVKHVVRG